MQHCQCSRFAMGHSILHPPRNENKGYAKFGSWVGVCVGGGGGGAIRCIMGDVQMKNGTLSSLVALRHVLHPQIRWRRLCDEPNERLRGK